VEHAGRIASDDGGGHALERDGPLERQKPLGLLADDGLLPQPDVLEGQPVVVGLEARVVLAQAVDLRDRGRNPVTRGAEVASTRCTGTRSWVRKVDEPRTASVLRRPRRSRLTTTSSAKGRRTLPWVVRRARFRLAMFER